MKAVLVLLLVAALAGVAVAIDAAHDTEFDSHEADALEVTFDAAEETGMEVESADALNTEAELVDSAAAAEADTVEFEDVADAAEGEAEAEADAAADELAQSDEENAADALDLDEADQALEDAEAAEGFTSLTSADASLAEGDTAGLAARKCTPPATLSCPDGSLAFAKISRPPDYNGCGASGAVVLNDANLGGQFSPCCNNHDICYGSPRSTKDACDAAFHTCMKDVCKSGDL